jgi:hypothetical protein
LDKERKDLRPAEPQPERILAAREQIRLLRYKDMEQRSRDQKGKGWQKDGGRNISTLSNRRQKQLEAGTPQPIPRPNGQKGNQTLDK